MNSTRTHPASLRLARLACMSLFAALCGTGTVLAQYAPTYQSPNYQSPNYQAPNYQGSPSYGTTAGYQPGYQPAAGTYGGAPAYQAPAGQASTTYTSDEIVVAGHQFFGKIAGGLATMVEKIVGNYGLPNGYIIGQEASGALLGGLRYGEGTLYTKTEGQRTVFWQGPSFGWDVGGDGNRTMMLVYDLPQSQAIYRRYVGVNGSAYLVGGLGMTVLSNTENAQNSIHVVPIRSGLGARLGINVGYLKFTPQRTWNPF